MLTGKDNVIAEDWLPTELFVQPPEPVSRRDQRRPLRFRRCWSCWPEEAKNKNLRRTCKHLTLGKERSKVNRGESNVSSVIKKYLDSGLNEIIDDESVRDQEIHKRLTLLLRSYKKMKPLKPWHPDCNNDVG